MKRTLTAKSASWTYEREGRIIRKEAGLVQVPPECLKQICFGVNVDAAQERLVRQAVSDYRHVQFARMRRDPDSDARLKAEDC
jgi:hypothetical protein